MLSATGQPDSSVEVRSNSSALGLYVHIPFCATKCTYCDFNTYAGIEHTIGSVVDAIDAELRLWSDRTDIDEFSTVFFGGGTPSYVPHTAIGRLLDTAHSHVGVAEKAEITLEANPDDVNGDSLSAWHDSGVNRLSIGIQSFDDTLLVTLSRRHSSEEALSAVQKARDAGFSNMSIDLMYGLPNQTLEAWNATLDIAIDLQLPHLSLYGLQIEPNTPLERSVAIGATPRPDDDLAADMYELAMDLLGVNGYCHYEISNWCMPNMQSAHNLGYWRNCRYLGVGPGAHSNLKDARFWNQKSPTRYVDAIDQSASNPASDLTQLNPGLLAVEDVEPATRSTRMAETMMLGLRLSEGVSLDDFARRFNVDLREEWATEVGELQELGLVEQIRGCLRLTRLGRMLGNEVFEKFV